MAYDEKEKDKSLEASEYQKQLQAARAYKDSEDIFNTVAQNERFVMSDQWKNGEQKNLPPTVYNYLGQVMATFVSSCMATPMKIMRMADELSEEDERVVMATKAFNKFDAINWERCKMDMLNEKVLQDAFVGGIGGTYWYWDGDVEYGEKYVTKGDLKADNVDAINVYVANPNETDTQRQDWVKIVLKMTVKRARARAKSKGLSDDKLEMICGNDERVYEAYDKTQNTQIGSDQVDYCIHFERKGGKVQCVEFVGGVLIKSYDTGLTRYPIAIMPWIDRKKFYYGHSPVTYQIANQKVANLQASMRHLHAMLLGIPKVAIHKNMINNFTNTVGGIHSIDAPMEYDVARAIRFIQPTQMTFDVDKSINDAIDRSKSLLGANQSLMGEANPENFRAIMAQQKQAGIPLESVIRRYKQYIEDVALIWLDFYKTKYNVARFIQLENEEGEKETAVVTGTDFKDIYMQTKIEVGPNTQWAEGMQLDAAKMLWEMGIITDKERFLENVPDSLIVNKDKLIKDAQEEKAMKQQQEMMQQQQMMAQPQEPQGINIDAVLSSLSPEARARFDALPPEQQQAMLQEITGQM